MEILHISPYYKPAYIYGGPIISVSNLCEAQSAVGNKVTVFTTKLNGKEKLLLSINPQKINGVNVFYHNASNFSFFSFSLLKHLVNDVNNYDVIHVHTWWNFTAVLSSLIAIWKNKKLVITPRGMLSEYTFTNRKSLVKKVFHILIGKQILKNALLNPTATNELFDLKKLIPTCTTCEIPNIVTFPEEQYIIKENLDSKEMKLVFISRIHPKKGLELTFTALSKVNFNWKLTIIGSGEKEYIDSLKVLALNLKISNHINWVGWKNGNEKFDIISNSDLFILNSYNENFAVVVLEALSVGTPVIISNEVGLKDYVIEKKLGWVVDNDVKIIKETLDVIYGDQSVLNKISENSPELVRKDFSPSVIAEKYVKSYNSIKTNAK